MLKHDVSLSPRRRSRRHDRYPIPVAIAASWTLRGLRAGPATDGVFRLKPTLEAGETRQEVCEVALAVAPARPKRYCTR